MVKRQSSGGFRQSSVKVAVRCRPLSEAEKLKGDKTSVDVQGRTVTLGPGPRAHSYAKAGEEDDGSSVFAYDYAFGQNADQLSIFAECGAPLIKELLEGYNATVFAYGQTGSGKTHTMIGSKLEPGLVPRATWYLFERLKALNARDTSRVHPDDAYTSHAPADDDEGGYGEEGDEEAGGGGSGDGRTFKLYATYLQIYNETLIDMLTDTPCELKIRNSAQLGIHVGGLTEHPVRSPQDVLDLLEKGNSKRQTASTKMNAASSRSHAVFSLVLEQEIPVASGSDEGATGDAEEGAEAEGDFSLPPTIRKLRSKINLVDLAGSERAKLSGADEDAALMKECVNINKSLAALGNVIASLSEGKSVHVPYRESKLTQLLEESLGGNAQTVMINAVSPKAGHHAETLSTLHWAKRAQSIVNIATAGEALDASAAMEKMERMAKLQKQAVAEAQQLARERQLELQEELDAARADAEEARTAGHDARRLAKSQLEQARADFERRIEQARQDAEEGARHSAGAAMQRREAELRAKFADAEAASGALASSRKKERGLVADLALAAERETKLQRELRQLKGTLQKETELRERAEEYAEEYAEECREREDGAREAAEAAAARSREAAEERLRAVKEEADQRVEAAAAEERDASQEESRAAVEAAEAAAAELGDALAAKEDELMMLRLKLARAEQESQEAVLAKESAEEAKEVAEEAKEAADKQAAPLLDRVSKAEKRAGLAEAAAADAQSQLQRAVAKINALEQKAASAASEKTAVAAERDELKQLDAAARARSEEMAATVAAADARLAVQQEHRDMLQQQLSDAKAATEQAQMQARQPDAATTAIVHELRAALSRAQDEAKESLAATVRMESAKTQLEAEAGDAVRAKAAAVAERDEAREARAALQAELASLMAEVKRSRESVGKAMADVQSQVDQRKSAWTTERQELVTKLANAEQRAQLLQDGASQHSLSTESGVGGGGESTLIAATPGGPQYGRGVMSFDASSSSSESQCASPTRRSSVSVESQMTSASGGSGAPTGGSNHHHRHRSRSHERRTSSGLMDKPLGVRLPDFGFGSAEKHAGPASPPGTVEKTLKSWGKNIGDAARSLIPGGGKENGLPTAGGIAAPPPMNGPYERFETSTPLKHRHRERPSAATPNHQSAPYALPMAGLTPAGHALPGGFGRVPSSRSKGTSRRSHE